MQATDIERSADKQKYYFLLTFWGTRFREFVCRLTLPSLLGPENIPGLARHAEARLLIATTAEDWEQLCAEPIFCEVRRHIAVEFLPNNESDPPVHKYVRMSHGHAMLTDRCFRDRAIAINLNPDSIYPNGSVLEAAQLADTGTDVVLCAAVRFDMEAVTTELVARGMLAPGQPLSLSMREAARIGLRCFHPETLAADWQAPNFGRLALEHQRAHFLTCCFWRVDGSDDCILVTHNWSPFLVNYAVLGHHDTSALDGRALDGTYIFENFPQYTDKIEIVQDSDRIFLLGLTPHDEMMPLQDRLWWRNIPVLGKWTRGFILNQTVFDPGIDPYRRRLYRRGVRFHGKDAGGPEWEKADAMVARCLDRYATNDLRVSRGHGILGLVRQLWFLLLRPLMRLDRRHVWQLWAHSPHATVTASERGEEAATPAE